jgi:hypothetical protein
LEAIHVFTACSDHAMRPGEIVTGLGNWPHFANRQIVVRDKLVRAVTAGGAKSRSFVRSSIAYPRCENVPDIRCNHGVNRFAVACN